MRNIRVLAILEAIKEYGPMTQAALDECLGVRCASIVSRMRYKQKRAPKRLYVKEYVQTHDNLRVYPRAVYAIGDRTDAKKPKPDGAANSRKWREKQKKLALNSVFALGLSVRSVLKCKRDRRSEAAHC